MRRYAHQHTRRLAAGPRCGPVPIGAPATTRLKLAGQRRRDEHARRSTSFRAGHLPVTGEALALPLIELAGSERVGDAVFDEIFHPLARRLLARCDAVLRVGGASAGADEMVELARADGKLVVSSIGGAARP